MRTLLFRVIPGTPTYRLWRRPTCPRDGPTLRHRRAIRRGSNYDFWRGSRIVAHDFSRAARASSTSPLAQTVGIVDTRRLGVQAVRASASSAAASPMAERKMWQLISAIGGWGGVDGRHWLPASLLSVG